MSLEERIAQARANIARAAAEAGRDPGEITLAAATKVQTSETIRAAIAAGITVCGENRVQELTAHLEDYAYDGARVHFIGHLQTNKVRFVVGRVDLIESVDSPRLLEAVQRQAEKLNLVQDILLEVNIGREESKGGCLPEDLPALARQAAALSHVRLRGLMAIPPAAAAPGPRAFRQGCQGAAAFGGPGGPSAPGAAKPKAPGPGPGAFRARSARRRPPPGRRDFPPSKRSIRHPYPSPPSHKQN